MPQTLIKESAVTASSGRVFSPVNITQLDTDEDEEEEEASCKSSSGRSTADLQCRTYLFRIYYEEKILFMRCIILRLFRRIDSLIQTRVGPGTSKLAGPEHNYPVKRYHSHWIPSMEIGQPDPDKTFDICREWEDSSPPGLPALPSGLGHRHSAQGKSGVWFGTRSRELHEKFEGRFRFCLTVGSSYVCIREEM